VKDLNKENYKILKKLKKIPEDGKTSHTCGLVKINVVKMTVLLKATYSFNTILIKIPMVFFTEIEKSILKFIWKHKRPQRAKTILSKNSNTGNTSISNFKLYNRPAVTKTVWHCQKQT
jgi:hypothetical protein